jgi:hypothetical protein
MEPQWVMHRRGIAVPALVIGAVLSLASCTSTRHAIVAATGTNIGVDVSQNPATNSPQAKLGYQRVELAIVPTNRSAGEEPGDKGGGASEYGDVLMELRYGGIFDTGPSSGIYQRLAVGSEAVRQPGASLMFARDADGNVSEGAEAALRSLMSVPAMPKDMRDAVTHIRKLRACHREEVDAAITASGAGSYDDIADHKVTVAQLEQIMAAVQSLPPCP